MCYMLLELLDNFQQLIYEVWKLMFLQISMLMCISDKLVGINVVCFYDWQLDFMLVNVCQVILVFKGDVYIGLQVEIFSEDDFDFV